MERWRVVATDSHAGRDKLLDHGVRIAGKRDRVGLPRRRAGDQRHPERLRELFEIAEGMTEPEGPHMQDGADTLALDTRTTLCSGEAYLLQLLLQPAGFQVNSSSAIIPTYRVNTPAVSRITRFPQV